MKKYFQRSGKVTFFSNIIISLLCTSYLFTGYCRDKDGNNISKDNNEIVADSESEVASQKGDETKTSVTSIVTTKKVNNSNKKYVPASYNEVTGNNIVNYAKKYLGLRYVSGGYSLSTGTDCSGFTALIYQEFGISLSRGLSGQSQSGSYISKSDLKKGDLVFYGYNDGQIHHVAIYIGDNQVIHESNRRDGVKISRLDMMEYITSRRVVTADKVSNVKTETKVENTYTGGYIETNNNDAVYTAGDSKANIKNEVPETSSTEETNDNSSKIENIYTTSSYKESNE